MINAPVAIVIFNRPALTERLFEVLSKVKPTKLLVIADGPRSDHPGDAELCAAARAVVERVDWDCEVLKNYSDVNLGCGRRPATGFDWVFQQVEEAIILEDDCLPELSFFPFCEELLALYRSDTRVMHINGSTFTSREAPIPHSYYFSQLGGCWGWATWRRAWNYYDFDMKLWPEFQQTGWLEAVMDNNEVALRQLRDKYQQAYDQPVDLSFWDYQWGFAIWAQCGLCIIPKYNLISNIGCGSDATHTVASPFVNIPTQPMSFPLIHPPMVLHNWNQDRKFLRETLYPVTPVNRFQPLRRLRKAMSHISPEFVKQMCRAIKGRKQPLTDQGHKSS